MFHLSYSIANKERLKKHLKINPVALGKLKIYTKWALRKTKTSSLSLGKTMFKREKSTLKPYPYAYLKASGSQSVTVVENPFNRIQ